MYAIRVVISLREKEKDDTMVPGLWRAGDNHDAHAVNIIS